MTFWFDSNKENAQIYHTCEQFMSNVRVKMTQMFWLKLQKLPKCRRNFVFDGNLTDVAKYGTSMECYEVNMVKYDLIGMRY